MEGTFRVNWSTEVTICQCLTIARKKILFFFKRSQVVENKEMHAFLQLPSPFIHPLLQRLAFLLIKTACISSITHTSRQPEHINSDQWKLGFLDFFFLNPHSNISVIQTALLANNACGFSISTRNKHGQDILTHEKFKLKEWGTSATAIDNIPWGGQIYIYTSVYRDTSMYIYAYKE